MEFQVWWLWMGLAGIFLLGELNFPKKTFVWFGLSSAMAGILALLLISIPGQIAVFVNFAGIFIGLEKRFNSKYRFKHKHEIALEKLLAQNLRESTMIVHTPTENVFRCKGDSWEIKYNSEDILLKSSIGMQHIQNLIRKEGEWIHASELKALASSAECNDNSAQYSNMSAVELETENLRMDKDVFSEDVIKKLPLNKLKEYYEDLKGKVEAGGYDDPDEKIDNEMLLASVEKYLNSVTNIKGQSRKLDNKAETDRKAISAAITRSRSNFADHEGLFNHFKSFIQAEGFSFRYLPDRTLDWVTE